MTSTNIQEQLDHALEISTFLESFDTCDLAIYTELINLLPPGLAAKLRLTPDIDLWKRLAHLYEVTKSALSNNRINLPEEYELESFEGLSNEYPEDCDLVVRGLSTGKLYFIDATSSTQEDVLRSKKEVIDSLALRYRITNHMTSSYIHQFEPYPFYIDIDLITEKDKPESLALMIVERLSSKSRAYNDRFIENCKRVYDTVLVDIATTDHISDLYNKRKPSPRCLEAAQKCISSNNVEDNIAFLASLRRKEYAPYNKSLQRLANQYNAPKCYYRYPASRIARHKLLETALTSLQDDLLAFTLLKAVQAPSRVVMMRSNRTFMLVDEFPKSATSKKMLTIDSGFSIAAKHVKGHVFTIKFSYDEMDPNLRRIILKEAQPKTRVDLKSEASHEKLLSSIAKAESAVTHAASEMLKSNRDTSISTVFDKIISMCNMASRDLGNTGVVSTNILSKTCSIIRKSLVGALISQRYEVANTFAASIKNSSKGSNYYVGVNGPFDSITITKMNSTQDSFKTRHYCVIGRKLRVDTTSELIKHCKETRSGVFRSEFYNMNTNELVYELKLPYTIMSLLTWDIENNLKGGKIDEDHLPDMITSIVMHSSINRDTFAQASQQSRYFYASSIGYGSSPAKITEKFDFFCPRYSWEFVYIVRMVKMGAALSVIRDSEGLSSILVDGELPVAFPHSRYPVKSFNQAVSSMYFCNVFNKFRAFHEIAAAVCYNDLDDENKIYEDSIKRDRQSLVGYSRETEERWAESGYLGSQDFINNEIKFVRQLIKSKPSRFSGSCVMVIAASNSFLKANESTIKNIYQELGSSPLEACTMRGSMDHKVSNDKGQAIRAASAIVEELMIEMGFDPEKVNKNPNLAQELLDRLKKKDKDFSLFSILIRQLGRDVVYRYRITDKDQVGTREISVLNAVFRMGALFFETVARQLSTQIRDVDVLEDASKEIKFEDAVKKANMNKGSKSVFFDNSDQKRWGPNHMLHFFSSMMYGCLPRERGLVKLLNFIAEKTLQKRAKFPEVMIRYFKIKRDRKSGTKELLTSTGSDTINKFFDTHYDDFVAEKFETLFRYGMCQGIFHSTSSIYHAITIKIQEDAMSYLYGGLVSVDSFVTSDDASRITTVDGPPMKSVMLNQHNIIICSGNVMNILRNDSKSANNPHIAEFNSIFYKNGIMATPSIKQRVSKLDVGAGENHFEDYLSALANASNYFSAGGSYSGAIILAILNLTLHTEQWNRWEFCNEAQFYKPVELGGFPVIEPFTTSICGALANFYLRVHSTVDMDTYAKMHVRNITSQPELVSLSDFMRTNFEKAAQSNVDLKIYKNAGSMGLISMLRTDRKLSMFERRCSMSRWNIPESFTTLTKYRASARKFIFNISRTADMTLHDVPDGVNSFYLRYTDPWVSELRKCHKVGINSSLVSLGFNHSQIISYSELKAKLLSMTVSEAIEVIKVMSRDFSENIATNILSRQLAVRFNDSKTLIGYISNQECETFIIPKHNPSTTRLTLKETSETDQNQYMLGMVKYLAGSKARAVITEFTKNSMAFDSMPNDFVGIDISLKDSVILADNNMHVFTKYVKSYTKMICSGRPADLTSVVTLILGSRFTEAAGVKTIGAIRLAGDYLTTLNYTGWYRDLEARSRLSMNKNARNMFVRTYADVVKFGVISDNQTIGKYDTFQITDAQDEFKTVIIDSPRKTDFRKAVRNWCCTNTILSLGSATIDSLFGGSILSKNEYNTGENTMTKVVYNKYFEIEVNSKPVIHVVKSERRQFVTHYNHFFLCKEQQRMIVTKLEINDQFKSEKWAKDLKSRMARMYSFDTQMTLGSDSVCFTPFTTNKLVVPLIIPGTITLALFISNAEFMLPICHSSVSSIEEVDLADSVTHENILAATKAYHYLSNRTQGFDKLLKSDTEFLRDLLFKFSYSAPVDKINRNALSSIGARLNSVEYDILRALLVADTNLNVEISPSKLYNTINNLCVESDSMSSFINSVKIGNNYISNENHDGRDYYRLGDLMEDLEIENKDLDDDNMPDDALDVESSDSAGSFNFDILDEEEFVVNFDDMEDNDDDDDLFDLLNDINKTSRQIDETASISRSVRTNHSLNPVDEYPSEVLKVAHDWLSNTAVPVRAGMNIKINNFIDLLRYYSTLVFSGQHDINNMIRVFYKTEEFKPIMPLSVLAAIEIS